ncbi:hypothetical protein IWQ47_001865 [Aquimarina sp. EL_43]|uniref:hypothetical protein n=1 Tax=unclassified Aquimarina TaxID=2627091 RepID=UPI0018C97DA5|nr:MULTISPECIES: hypothetical protein [unclassified Aquimarina]MBG6130052.1 hypothetical protein [Aquimarina sp. EL_35]MBG6148832.1 hypothetical protein [Aquimarina sp. EL_32]MBG6168794.1 hypothetical protein [Aquimarina sp. EL_43]
MKLIELLTNIEKIDEESVLYVKRIDCEFSSESEVTILNLTEEELEWKTFEVTEKKCPGFEYFMEAFLVKEFMEDISLQYPTLEKKCERLIHYVVFDA